MIQEVEDPEDFDDPAMVLTLDGDREWYDSDGNLHRDNDLPAKKWHDGILLWYQHGKIHRENGPAYVQPDGVQQWFINDVQVEPEEHREWRRKLLEERERQREELMQQIMEVAQDATVLKTPISVGRALRFQPKAACP